MLNILKPTKTIKGKLSNILVAVAIMIIWAHLMSILYRWLFQRRVIEYGQWSILEFKYKFWIKFYIYCLAAPIGEEIVFRHFPLQVIKASGKKQLFWPVILLTSVVFGWVHEGEFNLLIQGVIGFIAAVLYMKNGFSLLSAILFHAIWNFFILLNIFRF